MALPEIASEFAGYRIEELIGRGGMGVVYRAVQLRLDRRVAIKLILPELSSDANFRRRFERECRMAAALDHPHVIPIYEAGDVDGELFVSMRYVDGIDLGWLIAHHGRLEPKAAVAFVTQVAEALDAAHSHGLVHRDVKPANILIEGGPSGHLYLTDFGLAKRVSSKTGLTRTRQFVGTIDYTAPEQIQGGAVDYRADVYALGCLVHHVLTGHPPFERDTDFAALWAHVNDPPPSARVWVPELREELDAVISRAMAKNPPERFLSAGDLALAAVAAVEGRRVARPERTVARGAAVSSSAPPAVPPHERPVTEALAPVEARHAPTTADPHPPAAHLAATTADTPEAGEAQPAPPARESSPPAGGGRGPALTTADPSLASLPAAAAGRVRGPGRQEISTVPAVLVLLGVAIAGAGAFLVGGMGSGTPAADRSRLASRGTVQLAFPADWRALSRDPRIPGIHFIDQISHAPAGAPEGEALIAGRVDAGGPALLPRSFLKDLRPPPRRDDPVLLGDVPAYRYKDLHHKNLKRSLTIYVAPTTRAVVTIACMAPPALAAKFMPECEQAAGSLELLGEAKPFSLRPGGGYARTLTTTMQRLNKRRREGLRALKQAGTNAGQADAAARVEAAYARAASTLAGATFSPAARDANAALVKAMRGTRTSWQQLAATARIGDRSSYTRAREGVKRAESGVRKALSLHKPLGYRFG